MFKLVLPRGTSLQLTDPERLQKNIIKWYFLENFEHSILDTRHAVVQQLN